MTGDNEAERAAAYQAYLAMLGSGTVQLAVKVAHEHLNKHSLVVSAGPDGPRFRLQRRPHAAGRAPTARCGRRRRPPRPGGPSTELLRDGTTAVDSRAIFDSFPDHVEQGGRLVSLPEWHRAGLRELCHELFARTSTRAANGLMSVAFGRLAVPTDG